MSPSPLGYLDGFGERAAAVVPLTWATLLISIAVCVILAVLISRGVLRRAGEGGAAATRREPLQAGPSALRWIHLGVSLSLIPLALTLVWTMVVLGRTVGPPAHPGLVLDVTGHQWWWEVNYGAPQGEEWQSFRTANEIHVPVGERVLVRLHSSDVIHSFWVPKLTGKTDVIPGQINDSWFEADRPGRYRGQCGEFCGLQHAHMGFEVVAESPADFRRWRAAQLQPAPQPSGNAQTRGRDLVQYRCGSCHAVRGTLAAAYIAPDLTHLMSRRSIAAAALPNRRGTLLGWIQDPQDVKPGSLMPAQALTAPELADLTAYLEILR